MDTVFLKQKIEAIFPSTEAFARAVGVSKQSAYNWLNGNSNPDERHLFLIADLLEFSKEEVDRLLGTPQIQIFFRKMRSGESASETSRRSVELADAFFKIDGSSYIAKDSILFGTNSQDALAVSSYIRTIFNKKNDEPVRFMDALVELAKHNINIFFLPFKKIGIGLTTDPQTNREVAFTARKGSRIIIFVDSDRTIDQATFDICHELTHIILQHQDPTDGEDEKLCNKVAAELIYPQALFKMRAGEFDVLTDAKKYSWQQAMELFWNLFREFDWSPNGLGFALRDVNLIGPRSHEFHRMMKMGSEYSKRVNTIDTLFYSNFNPNSFDSLKNFFECEVQKDKDFYKPFLELRDAATFGRISPRKFAEILNLDSGDADELVRCWMTDLVKSEVLDNESGENFKG